MFTVVEIDRGWIGERVATLRASEAATFTQTKLGWDWGGAPDLKSRELAVMPGQEFRVRITRADKWKLGDAVGLAEVANRLR